MQLSNAHLTRQLDIIPMDKLERTTVHVVGCGAIGSFTALQLVKMGVTNITLWDNDEVSIENMSNQFYRFKDIGTNKAVALSNLIQDFTNVKCNVVPTKWEGQALKGIVLAAVDSMQVRKDLFAACRRMLGVDVVLDPRMGAEHAALYVMSPHQQVDIEAYNKTTYSDSEAVQERCTAKSTIYTVNLLSGLCAKAIKNIICGELYARVTQYSIRDNDHISFTSKKGL